MSSTGHHYIAFFVVLQRIGVRREQGSEQLPASLLLCTAFIILINLVLLSPVKRQPASVSHIKRPTVKARDGERRRTTGAINLTNGKLC